MYKKRGFSKTSITLNKLYEWGERRDSNPRMTGSQPVVFGLFTTSAISVNYFIKRRLCFQVITR